MSTSQRNLSSEFVELSISNSSIDNIITVKKRFNKNLTILKFKEKLELITGGDSKTMKLELLDKDNIFVDDLSNNGAILGSYPLETGSRVHIIDDCCSSCHGDVEKYVLPEEKYNARVDTLRNFMKMQKCGKYSEEYLNRAEPLKNEEDMIKLSSINVNDRCVIGLIADNSSSQPKCKGTVMYKGQVDGKVGTLIGVKYDKPIGSNNGTYEGRKYFKCDRNYGEFVKPEYVHCGDYPADKIDEHDDEI